MHFVNRGKKLKKKNTTFMQLYRNMQFIVIFTEICKNMPKKI